MKRYIIIAFSILYLFLISCINAEAIDLTQNNYVKVDEDMLQAVYINKNSPIVIRYSPPYYIIKAEVIINDFYTNEIYVFEFNYFYDYNRQEMATNTISTTIYDKNGSSYSSETSSMPKLRSDASILPKHSISSTIGDMYFYLCYNMHFYKELQN